MTSIIDVKEIVKSNKVALPVQFSSSDQSKQSGKPSQTDKVDINVPSSHLNKVSTTSDAGSNVGILNLRPYEISKTIYIQ